MLAFNRPFPRLAVLLAMALLAACSGEEEELVIEHYRAPCTGEGRTLCLLVQGELETPPTRHYGGIEGFTFRNGIRQRIRVRKVPVEEPLQDASSERWVLAEVLSMDPVDPAQEFLLQLEPGDLSGEATTGYFVLNQQALRFEDEATRDRILARNTGSTPFEVLFQHDPTQADRWVAVTLY